MTAGHEPKPTPFVIWSRPVRRMLSETSAPRSKPRPPGPRRKVVGKARASHHQVLERQFGIVDAAGGIRNTPCLQEAGVDNRVHLPSHRGVDPVVVLK